MICKRTTADNVISPNYQNTPVYQRPSICTEWLDCKCKHQEKYGFQTERIVYPKNHEGVS